MFLADALSFSAFYFVAVGALVLCIADVSDGKLRSTATEVLTFPDPAVCFCVFVLVAVGAILDI